MGKTRGTDVLLALVDVDPPGIGGYEVLERLTSVGVRSTEGSLLTTLLRLEAVGDVVIDRDGPLRFAPTEAGRRAALDTVGGDTRPLVLVMADLVDFTAVTAAHGDELARSASSSLARAAERALREERGEVVKSLGDGFLGWLPPDADPVPALRAVAAACALPGGEPWPLRSAAHLGAPIRYHGDLYGADVNLVARLCDAAAPDQLVLSLPLAESTEQLSLRGVALDVPITRVALR